MEKNAIEIMYDEHSIIALADEKVQGIYHLWLHEPEKYIDEVNKLLSFFRDYADGLHHRKEEEVLFPALRKAPQFSLGELVDELEAHHVHFREFVHKIKNDLEKGDYPESWAILKEYCNDLLDHIAVENDELFVMAEHLLSPEEIEKIGDRFEDLDREMGSTRKEELESLVS